jgi:Arc/MetJ family transcription regulator
MLDGMKMTMHIDEALLGRVMKASGIASKTKTIDLALREMDRKAKLIELGETGLGLSSSELKEVMDPNYDLDTMRRREIPTTPVSYGKTRSRG